MTSTIIPYQEVLPEVPDHDAYQVPEGHLRKKAGAADEWEVVSGRRPSTCLLVEKLRKDVGAWRDKNYPGASSVTKRLFQFWFDEDHLVDGRAFRYYFGQREALETLAYLVEIVTGRDLKQVIDKYATTKQANLLGSGIVHQTTMDGIRQIRRTVSGTGETVQDIPPEDLRRYAFKMATGSGKTVVLAMAMVWSHFHKRKVPDSDLSTNFLVVAPNVIVYQRLEKDFKDNLVFRTLPLVPPEWSFEQKVILREDGGEPVPDGTLILTNVQQLYASGGDEWTPANAVEALLGRKPPASTSTSRSIRDRLKGLPHLAVFNDEAHHVHDKELAWNKTLDELHRALPDGLALWADFTATPKDQNGTYYPWIVSDYPLAQAVEDRIVKAPLIVHRVDKKDPDHVTQENVVQKYGDWIQASLERWRSHAEVLKPLRQRPVLFVMVEKNAYADAIGEWLQTPAGGRFKKNEILVIHTDREGGIRKGDLETLRKEARDIDLPGNKVTVIVSVLMLREGWDVRNVTVVLGLRPFTAKAKILPEQAVGRGLRLMADLGPDKTQTLEVLGTAAFEEFVRQLEIEGVGIRTVTDPPPPPIRIEPIQEKGAYDIAIPLTKPSMTHDYRRLDSFDPKSLQPIWLLKEVEETIELRLQMDHSITQTRVHTEKVKGGPPPDARELIGWVTNEVSRRAQLGVPFATLYPIVREYLAQRAFGERVDVERDDIRRWLLRPTESEGVARYLAQELAKITAEKRTIEFANPTFKLSDVKAFTWRRVHLICDKTIFNYVACFNPFEAEFAQFLNDRCKDVLRFASLGTTEQESWTQFKVDYLKPSGAIGFYFPDWVLVQKTPDGLVHWIVETKGRVWPGTEAKDAAISEWCRLVGEQTEATWQYVRVNQKDFRPKEWRSFADLVAAITGTGAGPLFPDDGNSGD